LPESEDADDEDFSPPPAGLSAGDFSVDDFSVDDFSVDDLSDDDSVLAAGRLSVR
jgi:hypothetical protein